MTTITTTVPFPTKDKHIDIDVLVKKYQQAVKPREARNHASRLHREANGTPACDIGPYHERFRTAGMVDEEQVALLRGVHMPWPQGGGTPSIAAAADEMDAAALFPKECDQLLRSGPAPGS